MPILLSSTDFGCLRLNFSMLVITSDCLIGITFVCMKGSHFSVFFFLFYSNTSIPLIVQDSKASYQIFLSPNFTYVLQIAFIINLFFWVYFVVEGMEMVGKW